MSDYRIEGAQTLLVQREGAPYHLHLFVPPSPPPASGWPLLLLLDASSCFATAVEALTRMSRRPDATGVSPMLIVGISSASGHDVDRRQWDFTTARPDTPAHKRSGGAPAFLDFLDQTVLPLVGDHAPVDSDRLTLFGHSLAGYFALWALTSGRPPFQRYCAASPSIWWDRPLLTEALASLNQTDRRLVMLMGEWEEELPPWQALEPNAAEVCARRKQRDMLGAAQAFTDDLARRVGEERARYAILPEEDHASILSAAIPRALRLAALP